MPELPEMEITARRLGEALPGERIESVLAPGINALKTFDPPLNALDGAAFTGVRRRGKLLLLDVDTAERGPLTHADGRQARVAA
jgi:formamidopyrimidine-DNA glycosylase